MRVGFAMSAAFAVSGAGLLVGGILALARASDLRALYLFALGSAALVAAVQLARAGGDA
jgi:hypothetical protein